MKKFAQNFISYFYAPAISLLIVFTFVFFAKINLNQPISGYEGDGLVHLLLVKNIINGGWFYSSDFVGFPQFGEKFLLHDFPLHSDFLNFSIFKFFSIFSSNPFLILNCFFISSFFLISLTCYAALRQFGIGKFIAVAFGVLYAFLPYHILRSVNHGLLSNYYSAALTSILALWIFENKAKFLDLDEKQKLIISPNKIFFIGSFLSVLIGVSGAYYALYSCIILVFSYFLFCLKNRVFFSKNLASFLSFIGIIFITFLLCYLPAFTYWFEYGFNPHVAARSPIESEIFSLRFADFFVPSDWSYFESWQDFRVKFYNTFGGNVERGSQSLGVFMSLGLIAILLLPILRGFSNSKKEVFQFPKIQKDRVFFLSGLTIISILFFSNGGLVSFFSMIFSTLRSHARSVVLIAFFVIAFLAIIFQEFEKKDLLKARIILVILIILYFVEQLGGLGKTRVQSDESITRFISDQNFINKIEKILPSNSAIFQMPINGFPEAQSYNLLAGYVHSNNLRWSYPAVYGRKSSDWQIAVNKKPFKDFIDGLKEEKFVGVYVDKTYYINNQKELNLLVANLGAIAKNIVISENKNLFFFEFN